MLIAFKTMFWVSRQLRNILFKDFQVLTYAFYNVQNNINNNFEKMFSQKKLQL